MKTPIIFPGSLVHEDVRLAISPLLPSQPNCVVSAGTIEGLSVLATTEKSTTIEIGSKPTDAAVINQFAYAHGIEDALTSELIDGALFAHDDTVRSVAGSMEAFQSLSNSMKKLSAVVNTLEELAKAKAPQKKKSKKSVKSS